MAAEVARSSAVDDLSVSAEIPVGGKLETGVERE
jgi:hypothetical protein